MDRSRVGRGVAIMAIAALAVAVVSPELSAAPLTRRRSRRSPRRWPSSRSTQINALVPGITIEEGELQRFGPVTAAVGEAEKTVKTFGPFTMSLLCEDNAGNVRVRIQVATGTANSVFLPVRPG